MKEFLKRKVRKFLQDSGLQISRIPSPEQFYESIKYKSDIIKEHELRNMLDVILYTENHEYYDDLLKIFVPDWDLKNDSKEFVAQGTGVSEVNLNTYRKVSVGEKIYFEKVYFSADRSVNVLSWFQKNIYELIKAKEIRLPAIEKVYRGDFLTIVYFEYVELTELNDAEKKRLLVRYTKDLIEITNENKQYLSRLIIPDFVIGLDNDRRYNKYSPDVNKFLEKEGIDVNKLKNSVQDSKHVLTHGSIHYKNIFGDAVVVDWDNFGIYPLGLEIAITYHYTSWKFGLNTDVLEWLFEEFNDRVNTDEWEDLERNFTYFIMIFPYNKRLFDGEKGNSLKMQLVEKLKVDFSKN